MIDGFLEYYFSGRILYGRGVFFFYGVVFTTLVLK
jgi:hypothetical protein